MIRLSYSVTYPEVKRLEHPENEREIRGSVRLESDSIPREQVCDMLFAGFGNHPGNDYERQGTDIPWTAGNWSIDLVHYRWQKAQVRSMSVGDVIHFENSKVYYICDSCGWLPVSFDLAQSWLKFPRQYGCCSFELKQWKIAEGIDRNNCS